LTVNFSNQKISISGHKISNCVRIKNIHKLLLSWSARSPNISKIPFCLLLQVSTQEMQRLAGPTKCLTVNWEVNSITTSNRQERTNKRASCPLKRKSSRHQLQKYSAKTLLTGLRKMKLSSDYASIVPPLYRIIAIIMRITIHQKTKMRKSCN
jgi:hypothetical protein